MGPSIPSTWSAGTRTGRRHRPGRDPRKQGYRSADRCLAAAKRATLNAASTVSAADNTIDR